MKKISLLTLSLFSVSIIFSQVGIGTIDPQADLHVSGEVLIQSKIHTATFQKINNTEEDFKLISRVTNSTPIGELKILDTEALTVAPVNTFEYEFTNIHQDNVTDVDLQYDSSKYIVSIANFRYEGDAIKKQSISGRESLGYFIQRTFEQNGTWHLEIRNRNLDLDPGDELTYKITLIVYDRAYFKKLPLISTNLNGLNSGVSSSSPVLN